MRTALDVALSYLSRRLLTRVEITQRLERKGYPSSDIEDALKRLIGWGYLNDYEYALSYARSKQSSYSKKRIEVELKRRGIDEELIDSALQTTYPSEQEESLCQNEARKIWSDESRRWENSYQYRKSYAKLSREVFLRQKVGQKLLQKGYSLDLIYRILGEQ